MSNDASLDTLRLITWLMVPAHSLLADVLLQPPRTKGMPATRGIKSGHSAFSRVASRAAAVAAKEGGGERSARRTAAVEGAAVGRRRREEQEAGAERRASSSSEAVTVTRSPIGGAELRWLSQVA